MTKRKNPRIFWLCDYCWNVFSTKRSALPTSHRHPPPHTEPPKNYLPVKLIEQLK